MAESKGPFECFRCRDASFPNTKVWLSGRDPNGKTVYVEEDGSPHVHKTQPTEQKTNGQQQQQSSAAATAAVSKGDFSLVVTALVDISRKLDAIVQKLDKQIAETK